MSQADPKLIERYTRNERANHWVTAICFVLLALSGLALFHPAMFWLTALFGGGQWTRILHPFVGVVMAVSFAALVLRFWRHNLIEPGDVEYLKHFREVLAKREDKLPETGRYNAGQKLLFFVMVACMALLFITGIVIWRRYFSLWFPVEVVRIASLIHAAAAFALIVGLVIHIHAAIWVKGSVRAMTRGTVTLGWARRHHPRWFRESVK